MLDNLSFSRFRAYFDVKKELDFPTYTGSAIRGALGHAMREVRYGQKPAACLDCPARSDCRYGNLYAYVFESPWDHPLTMKTGPSLNQRQEKKYPQPFVLEPPPQGRYLPGEILSFSFTLVGKAIAYFPFMACSLSLMKQRWFGRKRGQITLRAIMDGFSEGGDR